MRLVTGTALLLLTLLFMDATHAQAQGLTLNDCIELALKNRASIIAARGRESLASADKRAALGSFLPNVSASYSYSKGKETSIDPPNTFGSDYVDAIDTTIIGADTVYDAISVPTTITEIDEQEFGPSKNLNLSADIWVFNAGNFFTLAEANASKKAAALDVINSEQDMIYAVKVSYYAYLAAVQNVDVQKQAVERSEEQLKLIQSRYDLGSASRSDVLKQKVLFGNDRLAMLTANNTVVTSRASLAYTIGVEPGSSVEFSTEYSTREYEGSLEQALTFGFEHEPGLLASKHNLSAVRSGVGAANSEYLPKLSAFWNYNRFEGTQAFPIAFDRSSNTTTYGFRVSWNIFDGFVRERQVTSAKVSRNNAMAALSDNRNFVAQEIQSAYSQIEQQTESKKVAQENLDAAEEDLKITQEKYNLGAATILDLLNAQVSLKEAQVSLIRADFDLNLSIAQLENAMGKM